MTENNIFIKIINRELPSYILYENKEFIVILDAYPITEGHSLIIPKKQVDRIYNMELEMYIKLMKLTHKMSNIIEKSIDCKIVSISTVGLEINHVHVHIIPINKVEDLNYTRKKKLSVQTMENIYNTIKKHINIQ